MENNKNGEPMQRNNKQMKQMKNNKGSKTIQRNSEQKKTNRRITKIAKQYKAITNRIQRNEK